jgi:hypothetical protein
LLLLSLLGGAPFGRLALIDLDRVQLPPCKNNRAAKDEHEFDDDDRRVVGHEAPAQAAKTGDSIAQPGARTATLRMNRRSTNMQADFGVDRAAATVPYTLTVVGLGIGGIFLGRLADRHGIALPWPALRCA